MPVKQAPPRAQSRLRRPLYAFGAAAIAFPLALSSTTAFAATAAPADAVDAIGVGELLPDFQNEFLQKVDSDNIWAHNVMLSNEIGPRVAGTAAEDAAVDYIKGLLDEYGFTTEVETFDTRSQNYSNITPSRYTDEYASWQFRPAGNGVFTGAAAPVSGDVVDIAGETDISTLTGLSGKIVVANWIQQAGARNALLTDLNDAGAAAVVLVQTSGSESLPNPGNLPADLTDMVVVAGATNQGERIRTLLAGGPLTLSITTEQSRADSSNILGYMPAASGREDAPIVYIGAHIDSVVGSPGASDNGSGASIMTELARILGQYNLDAEIRVGGWGAEEIGIIGSAYHVSTMSQDERDRTIGAWNMDMAGTSHVGTEDRPFGFWSLTVDGDTTADNTVLRYGDEVSNIAGHGDLQIGQVGRSDHQSFRDVGIEAAVFSWMFWAGGTNIILEPAYHTTIDTLEHVSQERMGIAAEIIGGAAFRAALNEVAVDVIDEHGDPAIGTQVVMSCEGDEGWRDAGVTDETGGLLTHVPHATCDFAAVAENGARGSVLDTAFSGAGAITIEMQYDDEAPVASLAVDPEAGETGWHTAAPVAVTISASDNADDAPFIEYSINGGDWFAYEAPLSLTEDGVYEVAARATDSFDNVSEVVYGVYSIDTVKPVATGKADAGKRGGVTVAASDETSGVETVQYRIGAGDWVEIDAAADGSYAALLQLGNDAVDVQFRAIDFAGNVGDATTLSFDRVTTGGNDELGNTGSDSSIAAMISIALVLMVAGGGLFAYRRVRASRVTEEA